LHLFEPHLYDLVFNNVETRIISTSNFFSTLITIGYEISENILQTLIEKFAIIDGVHFDVEQLVKIYRKMGVGDDLPASNDFLNCKNLTFESI